MQAFIRIFSMPVGIVAMLLLSPFKKPSCINEGALVFRCATLPCTLVPVSPTRVGLPPSSPTTKSFFTLPLICSIPGLILALGLWKCRSMGLLPTGTGDWLAFESRESPSEISLL
ncbi:hypothetical protein V8E52_006423 [Russula decolorans]|jgi:hypothetical protein